MNLFKISKSKFDTCCLIKNLQNYQVSGLNRINFSKEKKLAKMQYNIFKNFFNNQKNDETLYDESNSNVNDSITVLKYMLIIYFIIYQKHLTQNEAKQCDIELMQKYNFNIMQLIELAGQSVAHCTDFINNNFFNRKLERIIVICGPGIPILLKQDNGCDGMVAARHLHHMGYKSTVLMYKLPEKDDALQTMLLDQCMYCDMNILDYSQTLYRWEIIDNDNAHEKIQEDYDFGIDALFGFSFVWPPKNDESLHFLKVLRNLTMPSLQKFPMLSIDIPSGWNVEKGNVHQAMDPDYLISLTLPKLGSKNFKGKHFLGGRFIPSRMIEEKKWKVPKYFGNQTFTEIN